MGIGPAPAARKALERAELTLGDIGLIELNEAVRGSEPCGREGVRSPTGDRERQRWGDRAGTSLGLVRARESS